MNRSCGFSYISPLMKALGRSVADSERLNQLLLVGGLSKYVSILVLVPCTFDSSDFSAIIRQFSCVRSFKGSGGYSLLYYISQRFVIPLLHSGAWTNGPSGMV